MRRIGLLFLTALLAGCGGPVEPGHAPRHGGRYAGIGIYNTGPMWQRMIVANRPQDAAEATLEDDEQVIVVVDGQTGEVRQCGNLSGHCIRTNPWSGQRSAPARLTEHAADIEAAENAANEAVPVANAH